MTNSPSQNASFIPKRGSIQRRKATPKRQVFIFSIITYSVLFASLLAAGIVFFYNQYVDAQLTREVTQLNQIAASFSTQDLLRAQEFDQLLQRADDQIDQNVALNDVLSALDQSIGTTVQIESLVVVREDDVLEVQGMFTLDSFDGAIFQRDTLLSDAVTFSSVAFSDVAIELITNENGTATGESTVQAEVTLEVPVASVLYMPETSAPVTTAPTQDLLDDDDTETSTASTSTATTTSESSMSESETVINQDTP